MTRRVQLVVLAVLLVVLGVHFDSRDRSCDCQGTIA